MFCITDLPLLCRVQPNERWRRAPRFGRAAPGGCSREACGEAQQKSDDEPLVLHIVPECSGPPQTRPRPRILAAPLPPRRPAIVFMARCSTQRVQVLGEGVQALQDAACSRAWRPNPPQEASECCNCCQQTLVRVWTAGVPDDGTGREGEALALPDAAFRRGSCRLHRQQP